jgi:peptidoglycan/LPS O-acetylase OafA/YrhL
MLFTRVRDTGQSDRPSDNIGEVTQYRGFPGIFDFLRTDKKAYPLGYLPALDGMRGMTTFAIFIVHSGYFAFSGVMIYMDVFFTMSGYLITSILINDFKKHGKIRLKTFYVRRFLRLFPAFTLMLVVMGIISYLFLPNYEARLLELTAAFFYLTDIPSLTRWAGVTLLLTQHTWSLSVEEQFYVVWPVVIGFLLSRFGVSRTTVACIFTASVLFALSRAMMTHLGVERVYLFYTFYARADSILLGCGLAVLLKIVDLKDHPRLCVILAHSLVPISIGSVVAALTMDLTTRWYYYVSFLFGSLPGAIAVAAVVQPHRTFMHRFFEHPVPVFWGRICYGLYVWHWPIFLLLGMQFQLRGLPVIFIGWPLTFACATASYYLIERQFMRARPV